tara:strand:+ start:158 stop:994 length:837 start_codon:yes stop_codon:yes gene_type:complete
MSLTTHDAYPESIEDIDAMVEENRRMKLLIRNLLKRTGSDGATSTALVRSSAWDQAPSVDAVQAMRGRASTKTPKGWGKRAAAQASGDDSDGSGPLVMRGGVKGPIAKKQRKERKEGPKKPLTSYTYYVQQMQSVCFAELAAQRADDEAKPNNGEVMSQVAKKWNKVRVNKEEHDRVKEECDTFLYYEPQIESACFDELAAQLAAQATNDGKKPKKPTEKEVKRLIVLKWKKVLENEEEYNKVKAEKAMADAKVGEKASPGAMPTDASPTSVVDDDGF